MTLADHEAAGARAYSRDEAMARFDVEPLEPSLDEVLFEEAYHRWLGEQERDLQRLVPEDMWVDPRIREQVAA